eukprot:CAMPEP_0197900678 /NCGR_PEP_ID=MMETSP1439-20131203/49616_1 /TAXON_ID=66791 /ORGANISM="Gonyaulax spinifera, Strain CCMP409" /LENGTH=121 /DNA_ID=CAMNT_0043521585 /DNA_START=197 /DNA_END=557 /DNA_ORIENTATION=+
MTACIVCRLPLAEAMLGLGTTDSPPPSASTLALLWVSSRDKLQGPLEGASREADGADIEGFLVPAPGSAPVSPGVLSAAFNLHVHFPLDAREALLDVGGKVIPFLHLPPALVQQRADVDAA